MGESIFKQFTKINMLNILIMAIVFVWVTATLKTVFTHVDLTPTAQATINSLKDIMVMVLGAFINKFNNVKKEEKL